MVLFLHPSLHDIMLAVNKTKVDICGKCGISHLQSILLLEATKLPNEDVSAIYVATRTGDFRETSGHFHLFVTGGQTVSTCDPGDQTRYFKPQQSTS